MVSIELGSYPVVASVNCLLLQMRSIAPLGQSIICRVQIYNSYLPAFHKLIVCVNIEDLIKLSDVMNDHSLGPNGGSFFHFFF